MLELGRRLIILTAAIRYRHYCNVRVTERLERDLRLAVLDRVGLRYADRLLRALSLN